MYPYIRACVEASPFSDAWPGTCLNKSAACLSFFSCVSSGSNLYLREAFEKNKNLRDAFQDIATAEDKTEALAQYLSDGWFERICDRVMDVVFMKENADEDQPTSISFM